MRTNRHGWLWGLPAVFAIWLAAIVFESGTITVDLKQRAESAVRSAGIGWAHIGIDGRSAELIGEAYSDQERKLARRVIAGIWGISEVADHSSLAPVQTNYVWAAAVNEKSIRLSGYYPSRAAHKHVVLAARETFPEREVADDMRPARGAPKEDVWLGAIQFGLAQLARLKRGGEVNLRGTELAVAGVATSVTAYRSIKGALYRKVPSGVVLIKDKVEPPVVSPYLWTVEFKDNQLVLGGYIPDERTRDKLIALAKSTFEKSPIVDKMAVAGGAPLGWLAAAATVLRQVIKLEEAQATMTDTSLDVQGTARKQKDAEEARAGLKTGLTSAFKLQHRIKYLEPTIPTVSPFVTNLASDGKRLSITGYTPGKKQSERIVTAAKKQREKLEVVDATAVAKGAPKGWQSCTLAGLQGLLKLDSGRVEMSGSTLLLTGVTKDEEVHEALPKQVRAAVNRSCTESVQVRLEAPPEPQLSWSAQLSTGTLKLSGEVPNSAIEEALLKAAKNLFPKVALESDMRVVPGRSAKWQKVAVRGLELLAKLRLGQAKIDGQEFVLSGEAPDTATATAIKDQLKAGFAKGYTTKGEVEIKSAAMLWAEREARRKKEKAEEDAHKEAERARKLQEEQESKRKAEEAARLAREDAAKRKLEEERRRAQQEELRRKEEEARRQARLEEERRKAEAAAQAARIREQKLCQQAIDETTSEGTIRFAHGSAVIDESSFPTLGKLAGLHKVCKKIQIEIGGHTDSSGSETGNQRLSEGRAKSVMDYLVRGGMPADKLTAVGYGE
ncbi:MAG: OmpA family protein, partial [Hyphomicrobiaceae bacterium]